MKAKPATEAQIEQMRHHVHIRGWGYATPYRMGIAAGELGIDVEPWWPTEASCKNFRIGVSDALKNRLEANNE